MWRNRDDVRRRSRRAKKPSDAPDSCKRFFSEVVDEELMRQFFAELRREYMDRLTAEIAPHALDLAIALIEWENRERCHPPPQESTERET